MGRNNIKAIQIMVTNLSLISFGRNNGNDSLLRWTSYLITTPQRAYRVTRLIDRLDNPIINTYPNRYISMSWSIR